MTALARFFRRRDRDRDIDRELQFHLDEHAETYIAAGLSPAEARRRARVDFGGVQQITEQVRDVWARRWLDDAIRDVQFAFRAYNRSRVTAATAIVMLALGIGINTALFTIVRQVLVSPLAVSNPHELVQIDCNASPAASGGGGSCVHSYPAFRLLSERHDGLAGIVAFSPVPNGVVASSRGSREVITGQLVSSNLFDVLGVAPGVGRLLEPADDRPGSELVAVSSHGYWQRRFGGGHDAIGQSITLSNHPVTIVGVLPRTFRGVTFGEPYDVFLPLGRADLFRTSPPSAGGGKTNILTNPYFGWLTFLGRRAPGVAVEDVGRSLEPVFRQAVDAALAPVPMPIRKQLNLSSDSVRVDVRPAASGAASNVRRGLEPTLRVLLVVVLLVLLITCANLAGLFLAHAIDRQREFSLRVALGAGRSRLLRQVFTESLLLAAIGGGVGLLVAQWMAPTVFSLATDATILRAVDLSPDRWMLAFTAALSIAAGLVVGAASVWRASVVDPQEMLRRRYGHGSPWLTKTLLAAQIALTVTLVGSAALLLQTLSNFRGIDAGFQPNQLLTIAMDAGFGALDRSRAAAYVREATASLAALPGAVSVTYSNVAVGTGVPINLVLDVHGYAGTSAAATSSGIVSAGPAFVRTLGMTLLAGRDFEPADTDRETPAAVAIVNESFATHFFGTANAVGRSVTFRGPGNKPIDVVGVVKDARDRGVKRPTQSVMYLPFGLRESGSVTFTVRTSPRLAETTARSGQAAAALIATARRTLERIDPAVGIARIRTVNEQFDDTLRRERLLAALGAAFSGLALLLLAVGLYGMLNAMVVRRTTEIGVRMALGAAGRRIGWMLARETVLVLAIGITLGIAGYLGAGRLIRSELFGVTPTDPAGAVAAVALLIVVAAAAVAIPARRAAALDPASCLRTE